MIDRNECTCDFDTTRGERVCEAAARTAVRTTDERLRAIADSAKAAGRDVIHRSDIDAVVEPWRAEPAPPVIRGCRNCGDQWGQCDCPAPDVSNAPGEADLQTDSATNEPLPPLPLSPPTATWARGDQPCVWRTDYNALWSAACARDAVRERREAALRDELGRTNEAWAACQAEAGGLLRRAERAEAERDARAAELAAAEEQEPVAILRCDGGTFRGVRWLVTPSHITHTESNLYARPIPAADSVPRAGR